ncbi:hypothetical protein RTBOTA2_003535 [Rhodotorula toruloides]|nr:hypothetical protein RTBOTA2_003535 [Rhodotorula toruloides]
MAAPAAQNAANPAPTPLEHKLVKFDLEGHFHYTFTVDLELDLSDPKLNKEFALEGVPVAGKWTCKCWRRGDDVCFSIRHGALPVGIFGAYVRCKVSLFRRHDITCRLLKSCRWWSALHPEPEANPANSGKAYTGYQVKISRSALETVAENSNGKYCVERHAPTASFPRSSRSALDLLLRRKC